MIWLMLLPLAPLMFVLGYIASSLLARFEPDPLEGAIPVWTRGARSARGVDPAHRRSA